MISWFMCLKCVSSSSLWRVKARVSLADNSAASGSQEERSRDPETNLVDLQRKANAILLANC